MNKPVFYIVLFLCPWGAKAQENLVPNGSFEDTAYCPFGTNNPQALATWYNPTSASPDYYNSCAGNNGGGVPSNDWGYQEAQEGEAYIGIATYGNITDKPTYREYMQVKLLQPLEKDSIYCWHFWISRGDEFDYVSNNIGIALTTTLATDFTSESLLSLPVYGNETDVYSDSVSWKLVAGDFTASGGEEYLTLGNFFTDMETTTVQIQSGANGGEGAYYLIDNVFLGNCISQISFPNVFSPNGDGINDIFLSDKSGIEILQCTILNRWGQKIEQNSTATWDGMMDGIMCEEGVYFYVCSFKNLELNQEETKTGFIHLVR